MKEKIITKSFERLLTKGLHRGFITYEELGKSLGKRHFSRDNVEKAFMHIVDNTICLVEKKSDFRLNKKKDSALSDDEKVKETEKSTIFIEQIESIINHHFNQINYFQMIMKIKYMFAIQPKT